MIKSLDKFVTGFFVVIFGILWYCSSRYQVKPSHYTIVVHDVFGKQTKINGIRTSFRTLEVTQSYISEYHERFEGYGFSIGQDFPIIKNPAFKIFKKIQR